MSDQYRFGNTEDRCSTIIFKIKTIKIGIMNLLLLGNIIDGFCHFKNDVACKPITDHYIRFRL